MKQVFRNRRLYNGKRLYEHFLNEWSEIWFQDILDISGENEPEDMDFDFGELSSNPNASWDLMQNNTEYFWCDSNFNPNIDVTTIRIHHECYWNYEELSAHPCITLKTIRNNLNCCNSKLNKWDYCTGKLNSYLSSNPNLTLKDVENDGGIICDYYYFSANKHITWEIVQNNPHIPWDYNGLSCNPNITIDIIRNNLDKPWSYYLLSSNESITWKIIQDNPDIPWDYNALSKNPNITWEIVQSNPNIDWNDYELSLNPNITFEIVRNNPQIRWNYVQLSRNKMTFARENYIRKRLQDWFKKSPIKEELIAVVWHPKNEEKFKYLDPEIFAEIFEE